MKVYNIFSITLACLFCIQAYADSLISSHEITPLMAKEQHSDIISRSNNIAELSIVEYTEKLDSIVASDGNITRYEYDDQGRILSTKSDDMETTIVYDDDGGREMIRIYYDADKRIKSKDINKYSKYGHIYGISYNINDKGESFCNNKSETFYDDEGRMINDKNYWYNYELDSLYLGYESIYTYNNDVTDNKVTFYSYDYSSKKIYISCITESARRNADRNTIKYFHFYYNAEDGEVSFFNGYENNYDANGNLISLISYDYDYEDKNVYLSGKAESTYDADGRCVSTKEYTYDRDSQVFIYLRDKYSAVYLSEKEYYQTFIIYRSSDSKEVINKYYKNDYLLTDTVISYTLEQIEWLPVRKAITVYYENSNVRRIYEEYYYVNGELHEMYCSKYDVKGNYIEWTNGRETKVYNNTYDAEGRLKEQIYDSYGTTYKYVYNYYDSEELEHAYYVVRCFSIQNELWPEGRMVDIDTTYYVPYKSDVNSSLEYQVLDSWSSSAYSLYSDSTFEHRADCCIINGKFCLRNKVIINYNEYGQETNYEAYRNEGLSEGNVGELKLVEKREYTFDESTLSSTIAGAPYAYHYYYKLLSSYISDNGNEHTEVYYYSPFHSTVISTFDYAVYPIHVTGVIGKQVELPISLKNINPIATWQADLVLPEGFTIATDEYEDPMIVVSGSRTTSARHSISTSTLSSGATRILYGSQSNKTISGNDGEVATITLNIAEGVEAGDYPIIFKNIVMSEANETGHKVDQVVSKITVQSYTPGDVNNDGEINAQDLVAVVNYILENPTPGNIREAADHNNDGNIDAMDYVAEVNLILSDEPASAKAMSKANGVVGALEGVLNVESFAIAAGEEKDILVSLLGANTVYACCQFDVTLPKGMSISDAESTMGSHSVAFRTLDNGATRILVASTSNKPMRKDDIVRLAVKADKNMMEGDYNLGVDNALLVTSNASSASPASAQFSFTVGNATGIDTINTNANHNITRYNVIGQRVNAAAKGMVIVNGKKQYVK